MTKPKAPKKKGKAGTSREAAEQKRLAFVEHYLANGSNASQAAIAAGYSAKTAGVTGAKMLKDPRVKLILEQRTAAIFDNLKITSERTLLERARLAYYDIGELAKAGIKGPADIANLPDEVRQAVTGWKWDVKGNFTLLFADKNPHLSAIDRYIGLYEKDNAQKVDPLADLLARVAGSGFKPVK